MTNETCNSFKNVAKAFADAGLTLISSEFSYEVFEVLGDEALNPEERQTLLRRVHNVETVMR